MSRYNLMLTELRKLKNAILYSRPGVSNWIPRGPSVCRFLWFPFNQLSIKACRPRCVHSLANQWLEWTKGAENNQKTSRHSGPPGLEFDTCALDGRPIIFFNSGGKYTSLCIIQFQVAFLDAAAGLCWVTMIFQSTPEPMWLCPSWWHDGISNNTAWRLNGHAHSAAVSALGLYAPRFPLTPWIFSRYYELWMVKDLNSLQSCAKKHCLWTDWQFSHKVWHKVVNHDPSLLAKTRPLVEAPFILNLDNLTCYQLNC